MARGITVASGATAFTWDGVQDAGGIARDGSYRVQVLAASGAPLGAVNVVVDTNGVGLQDTDPAWIRDVDLGNPGWVLPGTTPPRSTLGYRVLAVLPDEKTALLGLPWGDTQEIDRQPLLGGTPEPVPVAWPPLNDSYIAGYTAYYNLGFLDAHGTSSLQFDSWKRSWRLSVSPDGTRIALAGKTPSHRCTASNPCRYPASRAGLVCNGFLCWGQQTLETGEPRVVLLNLVRGTYDIIASAEDDQHAPALVQFTPDGSRILFGSTVHDTWTAYPDPPSFTRIYSVAATSAGGTPVRLLEAELPLPVSWFRVSPDGTRSRRSGPLGSRSYPSTERAPRGRSSPRARRSAALPSSSGCPTVSTSRS